MQHVVGIYEQRSGVRIEQGVALKGFKFVAEIHHPAVRHRAGRRYAEGLSRQHRRRAVRAADIGRSRAVDRGIQVVRAPSAEVKHAPAVRSLYDAPSLGSDEALVVYLR